MGNGKNNKRILQQAAFYVKLVQLKSTNFISNRLLVLLMGHSDEKNAIAIYLNETGFYHKN